VSKDQLGGKEGSAIGGGLRVLRLVGSSCEEIRKKYCSRVLTERPNGGGIWDPLDEEGEGKHVGTWRRRGQERKVQLTFKFKAQLPPLRFIIFSDIVNNVCFIIFFMKTNFNSMMIKKLL
jgi:hypothetical protein